MLNTCKRYITCKTNGKKGRYKIGDNLIMGIVNNQINSLSDGCYPHLNVPIPSDELTIPSLKLSPI